MIPDLAIDVVSPSNSAGQVLDKVREYLQAGVQLVWIIYPTAGEIHVFDARNLSSTHSFTDRRCFKSGVVDSRI